MAQKASKKAPVAAPRRLERAGHSVATEITRALAHVRKLVLHGELTPNKRIAEADIAARLKIQIAPVRLALDRLAHDGLLEPLPSGGFAARTFTVAEICVAIELRAVLEGAAARLATERVFPAEELNVLRRCAQKMREISQPYLRSTECDLKFFTEYCELNTQFHIALIDLAGSALLRRTWDQIQSMPFAAPSSTILPQAMHIVLKSAVDQHQLVIEAIARRDGARAEAIARSHAQLAFSNLDGALRSARPGAALVKVAAPPLFDPGTRTVAPLKLN